MLCERSGDCPRNSQAHCSFCYAYLMSQCQLTQYNHDCVTAVFTGITHSFSNCKLCSPRGLQYVVTRVINFSGITLNTVVSMYSIGKSADL